MRAAAAAVAALVLAPAAAAWTPFGAGVQNTTKPALLVTQAGTRLAAYDSRAAGTISVVRNGGAPRTVVTGDPVANRVQLVQQPGGAIQLYYPNPQGVARLTSNDDGQTWTGPAQTQSRTLGPVEAAAVGPDGTPYFAQDGTGFVNVFRGLNGEQVRNVYPRCCGYHESLAVDTAGLVQIAFYSNADPNAATVYEALAADLTPAAPGVFAPVIEHEAPLVADSAGNTYLAWAQGYPTSTSLSVLRFRGGARVGAVDFRGPFSGPEPRLALTVDRAGRLWVVWTQGGKIRAARSRSQGAHFGATVTVAAPGTVYQLDALGVATGIGTVDVVANTGSSLVAQTLQPGLSVRVYRKGKATWAQALDDGFGVAGARFRIAGRTIAANASGAAKVPRGRGTASASGYVAASFRVP